MDSSYDAGERDDDSDSWKNASVNMNGDQDSVAMLGLRKRVAALEWEKIEEQRALKEKISGLHAQVVHLRNEVEKGETVRQRLEFDLVKQQKAAKARLKEAVGREKEKDELCEQLRDRLRATEAEAEEGRAASSQALATQKSRVEEVEERLTRMRSALEEKMNEARLLAEERSRTATEVEVLEGKLDELRHKFVSMSEQCQAMRQETAERNEELGACRGREAACRKELDAALARAHAAEEAAEREKAGQLEQRYNADLVQLRLREAESLQQAERQSKQEALQLMEELSGKLREMEGAWEEEKKLTANYRQEFERVREEHLASRACLTEELSEKRAALEGARTTTRRLEEETEGMRRELAEVRVARDEAEDRLRRLTNDLRGLVDSSEEGSSPPRPRSHDAGALLEQTRLLLTTLRRRTANAEKEASRARALSDTAQRECRAAKQEASGREKALQTAAAASASSGQEVKALKRKLGEVERRLSELRAANSEQKRRLDKAAEEATARKEEMQRVKKGRRLENEAERNNANCHTPSTTEEFDEEALPAAACLSEESSATTVRVAPLKEEEAERVVEVEVVPEQTEERVQFLTDIGRRLATVSKPDGDATTRDCSWSALKGGVSEQLTSLLTSVDNHKTKIVELEASMGEKERLIEELRCSHEAQCFKYENLNQTFSRQKKEMEEHYNKLMQDMQAKSKQSQSEAEAAWARIHASGNVRAGLESECAGLRSAASHAQAVSSALQTAAALLLSQHQADSRRAAQLACQRRVLTRCLDWSLASRRRLRHLGAVLGGAAGGAAGAAGAARARFRAAVMAVLAAGRLRRLGRDSCRLPLPADTGLDAWLRCPSLVAAADDCLRPLAAGGEAGAVERCLAALLERVRRQFFPEQPFDGPDARVDALWQRLAPHAVMEPVAAVETGVLALSTRLMAADALAEGLEQRLAEAERRVGSVAGLRRALEASVPAETAARVQAELERSRAAAAEAESLLQAQTEQLEALSARVDQLSSVGSARDSELRQAAEMLARSRVEMKRREQSARSLARQAAQLEAERAALAEKASMAEEGGSRARLERDLGLAYLTAVLDAVGESARLRCPGPPDLRQVLTAETDAARQRPAELDGHVVALPPGEPPTLIAARNAVRAVAEAGLRWQRKAVTAEEKVAHYRRHVAVLKREMAAACQRAVDCPEELLIAPTVIRISPAASPEPLLGDPPGHSEC